MTERMPSTHETLGPDVNTKRKEKKNLKKLKRKEIKIKRNTPKSMLHGLGFSEGICDLLRPVVTPPV